MKNNKGRLTDSSARFYPIFATKKYQSLYRVTAILDGEVDSGRMQTALNLALIRYKVFKVKLKRGYAWHRLVYNDAEVKLFEADGTLLSPIDFSSTDGYLFRASYAGKAFMLDVFHGLTDGSGAQEYFDLVISIYRRLESERAEDIQRELEAEKPDEGWEEDAFIRHSQKISLKDSDIKRMAGISPTRVRGTLLPMPKSIGYVAGTDEIYTRARELGVSFTAYLVAALAKALERSVQVDRPIVIMIPINLKALFETSTKQNFTLFARVTFKPQEFDDISEYASSAARQIAEQRDKEALRAQISTTVKGMNNSLMKAVPIFLKALFAKIGRAMMKSRQTVIISNLGTKHLEEFGVERIIYNLNVSKNNVQNIAVLSMAGKSELTFTSLIEEEAFPSAFVQVLREDGINVKRRGLSD